MFYDKASPLSAQNDGRTGHRNFNVNVLADTLLISVNVSVGELIGKLGFLKSHGICRVINYICSLLRAVT